MKICWLIIISSFLTISCNNDQRSRSEKETTEAKHEHEEAAVRLELNNGAKWKADSNTNSNVRNLQAIVEKFNSGNDKTLNAYHSTANALQAGVDKMISECKMKGPDHDALHKWLESLISEVSKLKRTTSEQEAAEIIK
ncbi:MAG TPA: hypothetical protein VF144_18460, partial [Chitinophagaceae bacterium]